MGDQSPLFPATSRRHPWATSRRYPWRPVAATHGRPSPLHLPGMRETGDVPRSSRSATNRPRLLPSDLLGAGASLIRCRRRRPAVPGAPTGRGCGTSVAATLVALLARGLPRATEVALSIATEVAVIPWATEVAATSIATEVALFWATEVAATPGRPVAATPRATEVAATHGRLKSPLPMGD